jgi:putative ATP-dependent endonuclease of OLD family
VRIAQLSIKKFRGISEGKLSLPGHAVLIGDNNSGKSSVIEAIDLALGPDRINRVAAIDEHDFYAGRYLDGEGNPVPIEIEVTIVDLNPEQVRHFKGNLEFWDETAADLVAGPPIAAIEDPNVKEALRVGFRGWYDSDDDDFKAHTFFCSPLQDSGEQSPFRTIDKRRCGFLLLRALRTGSRALSLERGSLLDIILRVQELRPKMWEKVLQELRVLPVAADPELGITQILSGVQAAIRSFVPFEWASEPHLRVSDLTRENLRRTLTVFMATGAMNGETPHAAPFQHQGNGTINMLVLALLSMIADAKETVIFAMEEPDIAIPPSTQKRIVDAVRSKSSQSLFTSHSPYVLEEFSPNQILVLRRDAQGKLSAAPLVFPPHIKPKAYSSEFRLRFAEALLARRVLITEGETETIAYPAAARRLRELDAQNYASLAALGIAVFNARADNQVAGFVALFRGLGKTVFAAYDKQADAVRQSQIVASVDYAYEAPTKAFETLLLNETAESALRRFAAQLVADGEWPQHLAAETPQAVEEGAAEVSHNLLVEGQRQHGRSSWYVHDRGDAGNDKDGACCNQTRCPASAASGPSARRGGPLGGRACRTSGCANSARRFSAPQAICSCSAVPAVGRRRSR